MPHVTATITKIALRWRSNAHLLLMLLFTQYKTMWVTAEPSRCISCQDVRVQQQGCQVALFRQNFRNLASFPVGWPKNINLVLFGLISDWLALKSSLGFLAFLG